MIVSMWMTRELVTIAPTRSISEAAALLNSNQIRRLPVVEPGPSGPHLVGILSTSDLTRALPAHQNPHSVLAPVAAPSRITVADIMQRQPWTTTPQAPIEDAARIMRDRKIGALPVVHQGTLVGLITESDIFRAFVALFETPTDGLRITFDLSKGEDIFTQVGQLAKQRGMRVVGLICSQQDDRPVCVVKVVGAAMEAFLDDLWKSGHPVLSVLRFDSVSK